MIVLSWPACSVRHPSVPRVWLLSHAKTPPPPYRANMADNMLVVGLLPAPPLPLTTAIVRGPGHRWDTACTSSRSACSAADGLRRSPRLTSTPRHPLVAGLSCCFCVRNDSLASRRVRGCSLFSQD